MDRSRILVIVAAGAGLLALTAAQQPSALSGASPGDWELSGVPGASAPVHQCVADLATLAQYEHRGRNCTTQVVSEHGNSSVIQYSCAGSDFGRTQIDVLTSR